MTHKKRQSGCESLVYFNHNAHLGFIHRAKKVLNLRLFDNPVDGKPWDKSASDLGLEILCVSQVRYSIDVVCLCVHS